MDLSSLTLDRLGLSVRSYNALRRRKIHTAERLQENGGGDHETD